MKWLSSRNLFWLLTVIGAYAVGLLARWGGCGRDVKLETASNDAVLHRAKNCKIEKAVRYIYYLKQPIKSTSSPFEYSYL